MENVLKKSIEIFLLLVVLTMGSLFYLHNNPYPACCDTAITLLKAKEISMNHSVNGYFPINPSSPQALYSSYISSEFPLHSLFAAINLVNPAFLDSLVAAKYAFVGLFMLPLLGLYLFIKRTLKSSLFAFVACFILLFSFWFGNMFWMGLVAQMLGLFFLSVMAYFLQLYLEKYDQKYLITSFLLLLVLFFVHVLSFLAGCLLVASVVLYSNKKKTKNRSNVFIIFGFLFLISIVLFSQTSTLGHLLPNFEIIGNSVDIRSIVSSTIPNLLFIVFSFIGLVFAVYHKKIVLVFLLLSLVILSQSDIFKVPFYSYRFTEFIVIPVVILFVFGLQKITERFGPRLKILVFSSVFLLVTVFNFNQQLAVQRCYVANCSGLYATQVSPSELNAFLWLKNSAPKNAIVLSPAKFGYFIPIVSGLKTELADDDKALVYTSHDVKVRNEVLKKYNISYVIWNVKMDNSIYHFKDYNGYINIFESKNSSLKVVYSNDKTLIYEIK